jgi:hypothetical protein
MKIVRLACLVTLAGTAACSSLRGRVQKNDALADSKAPREGQYEAIGIGASDPRLHNDAQRKAVARSAAIVKAHHELLSMIRGVKLKDGNTVDRAMERNSSLETQILEAIIAADVVKSEFTTDSDCVVTIRLPKRRLEELTGDRRP